VNLHFGGLKEMAAQAQVTEEMCQLCDELKSREMTAKDTLKLLEMAQRAGYNEDEVRGILRVCIARMGKDIAQYHPQLVEAEKRRIENEAKSKEWHAKWEEVSTNFSLAVQIVGGAILLVVGAFGLVKGNAVALLVSALWGMLSTRLFLQSWLAAAGFVLHLLGFVRGAVPRKDNALGLGIALVQVVLFSLLLRSGDWLLTRVFTFGWTKAENIIYWVFAAISALYMLPQIPSKIRKSWRHAMISGSLDEDILKRRPGRAA
jgi:hypothetical protein